MVKDACVSCFERLPATKEYFETYGNYCRSCGARTDKIVKARMKVVYLKNLIKRDWWMPKEEMANYRIQLKYAKKELKKLTDSCPHYVDLKFDLTD